MNHDPARQMLAIAVAHHNAGRLPEAERLYREILAHDPNHVDALHNLGVVANQVGRSTAAAELIRRAISLKANFPEAYYSLGGALHAQGQYSQAALAYRQSIALKPSFADAYNGLATALQALGQFDDAVAAYRRAIALRPDHDAALFNLGVVLALQEQFDGAIAAYRQAIAVRPTFAAAHNNLATILLKRGRADEAIASFRQAIASQPQYGDALNNLGVALREQGRFAESVEACQAAVDAQPGSYQGHYNLGNSLKAIGRLAQAIDAYRAALIRNPDSAEAHWNLALALLAHGDFPAGWHEYEWRWKWKEFPSGNRSFVQPLWDGSPLAGRCLLLHAEQGLGDTLQFIRYLPMVRQRAGKIIIECQPELYRLIAACTGDCQIISRDQYLPAFDVHCPLMSLANRFSTDLHDIPAGIPYIHADPALAGDWQRRMAGRSGVRKVGVAWAGKKSHTNDKNRSMPLSAFAPLAALPGVQLYSLQKGDVRPQLAQMLPKMQIIDWTDDLHDFADTAAMVANLDLIISVDTSVVHLAGAMGKPVWLLLSQVVDWRWMHDRSDSPWYPTIKIFRQTTLGDWASVMDRVAAELGQARPQIREA